MKRKKNDITTIKSNYLHVNNVFRTVLQHGVYKSGQPVSSKQASSTSKLSDKGKNLAGILLGIGNPLLDISAHNINKDVLAKYKLKTGDAIMAAPNHLALFEELSSFPNLFFTAGGAAQNTIRAAQWMLQHPEAAGFIGCIGSDHHGQVLQQAADISGIKSYYMVKEDAKTGVCAVLINESERSLVAHLGAAEQYHSSHFQLPEIQKVVEQAKYFYSEAFFVVVSHETLMMLGKHSNDHGKHFFVELVCSLLD